MTTNDSNDFDTTDTTDTNAETESPEEEFAQLMGFVNAVTDSLDRFSESVSNNRIPVISFGFQSPASGNSPDNGNLMCAALTAGIIQAVKADSEADMHIHVSIQCRKLLVAIGSALEIGFAIGSNLPEDYSNADAMKLLLEQDRDEVAAKFNSLFGSQPVRAMQLHSLIPQITRVTIANEHFLPFSEGVIDTAVMIQKRYGFSQTEADSLSPDTVTH